MKLAGFDGGFGRVEDDRVIPLGRDLLDYLGGGPATPGEPIPLTEVPLRAPIPNPGKIVCIGLNYRDHAQEANLPIPEEPILFGKWANSVIGPGETIVLPDATRKADYEAELAVVIGTRAKDVEVADALGYVAGYTCANDVSARELQGNNGGQWTRGKAIDTFLPTGPWLVTPDEIPDPQALGIRCVLNGDVMQNSSTGQMVFGVAELISFVSRTMTLEPGDVIATGTPPGVGFARTPPVFLRDGDRVTIEIQGIGALTNPVRR